MAYLELVENDSPKNLVSYLTSKLPVRQLDFSNSTLVQILSEHDSMIAKRNGGYHRDSDLISWIIKTEEEADTTITPDMVTDQFYDFAIDRMLEQGLLLSTINAYLSKLKNILCWADKHNARLSDTYKEFHSLKYEDDKVALTPDEVSQITHFRFDLCNDENGKPLRKDTIRTLSKVRDMFVLQCNLGQRHSDMVRLTNGNFDESMTTYKVFQKKTGSKAVVDLNRMTIDRHIAHQILQRYDYTFPIRNKDINRFNKLLHKILRLIGGDFNKEVTVCTYKAMGEVRVIKEKLHEAITSHTARRTYVTIMVNRGVNINEIRKCTGHKSLSSFEGYIKGEHLD